MKSSTIRFNLYMAITFVLLLLASYTAMPNLPDVVYVVMTIATGVLSEFITFVSPSGEFVSVGENWTAGKWITRVGTSLLSIMALLSSHHWLVILIGLLTPFVEMFMRVYGSSTPAQEKARYGK